MAKELGKKIVLFIVVVIAYFGTFSWQVLAFKKFQYNWAFFAGITAGIFFSITDRFLKWANTPEFQGDKLIKPFVVSLLISVPIILLVVLPGLKLPCHDWRVDSFISFYVTCFFLNNASTTAIAKTFERLEKITKSNGKPKKDV